MPRNPNETRWVRYAARIPQPRRSLYNAGTVVGNPTSMSNDEILRMWLNEYAWLDDNNTWNLTAREDRKNTMPNITYPITRDNFDPALQEFYNHREVVNFLNREIGNMPIRLRALDLVRIRNNDKMVDEWHYAVKFSDRLDYYEYKTKTVVAFLEWLKSKPFPMLSDAYINLIKRVREYVAYVRDDGPHLNTERKVEAINDNVFFIINDSFNRRGQSEMMERIAKIVNQTLGENSEYRLAMCNDRYALFVEEDGIALANGHTVSPMAFREDCFECSCCGENFYHHDGVRARDTDNWACNDCAEENWFRSRSRWFEEEQEYEEYDDEDYAESEEEDMYDGYSIFGYDTNVFRLLGRKFLKAKGEVDDGKKKPLYMGVELEVLPRGRHGREGSVPLAGQALKNFAIFKNDGSLHDEGFEIVTLPASLRRHREEWQEFFKEGGAASRLRSYDTTCCGLHVHIDRSWLTPLEQGKFMVFYNNPLNKEFLSKVAGRDVSTTSRWCSQKEKSITCGTQRYNNDHYEAAGIGAHTDGATIEVRIFRGNVSRMGFFRCVEFVDAVANFSKATSAKELRYKDFLAWFNTPHVRAQYPCLWRFLIASRYLNTKHKRQPDKVSQHKESPLKAA